MNTFVDCIPCLIRQSLASVRLVTHDERVHEQVLREVLQAASRMDLRQPPAAMSQAVHRRIRELCRNGDPYRSSKARFNRLALDLLPPFRRRVEEAPDPWNAAVRLAIAGNIMDLGVKGGLSEAEIRDSIDRSLNESLDGNTAELAACVREARSILYLTDNAGEIVFDRLLIERMPREKVTVAVRGVPVINDATVEDAEQAGLTRLVEVIDNGSDAPGTLLRDCSKEFQRRFADADLIIAKGQGNYETLRSVRARIYFLLRVKCPVIARDIGSALGRMVLRPSRARAAEVMEELRP
ncbi:MAG: damage-control phosphatase ARMT1 family protein [Planctomycetota bacterium]